jgi:hypothetical protein
MGFNIIPTENDKMNSTLFAHNFVISYALWLNQVTVETAGGATKAIPVDGCPANKYIYIYMVCEEEFERHFNVVVYGRGKGGR